jgi:hypothetical protein
LLDLGGHVLADLRLVNEHLALTHRTRTVNVLEVREVLPWELTTSKMIEIYAFTAYTTT